MALVIRGGGGGGGGGGWGGVSQPSQNICHNLYSRHNLYIHKNLYSRKRWWYGWNN